MKKFLAILAALTFVALPLTLTAQYSSTQYTAFSGVSLLTTVPATKTVTSAPLRLPTFSGVGTLNITEAGITGSPSGCTIALSYVQNNALSSAVIAAQTVSFTPSTGVQQFNINPGTAEGDQYVATYACSSTYPTAGTISITFSPALVVVTHGIGGDPCSNSSLSKSNANVADSATTVQLVALSAGKSIYVCGFTQTASTAGTYALEYGTGTTCGTGTTALTGTTTIALATVHNLGWGGTIVTVPAGNALCLLNTTAVTAGALTYVQQ